MRIDYRKTTANPSVLAKVEGIKPALVQRIGKRCYAHRTQHRDRALLNLVTNLLLCLSAKDGYQELAVARDNNAYRSQERYGLEHVSRRIYLPLFDALVAEGLVQVRSGFHDRQTGKGFRTRLYPTQKLLEGIVWHPLYAFDKEGEPIELRDAEKLPTEYADNNFTRQARKRVNQYNRYIQAHQVDYLSRTSGQLGLPCTKPPTEDGIEKVAGSLGVPVLNPPSDYSYLFHPTHPSAGYWPQERHYSDHLANCHYKTIPYLALRRIFNQGFNQGGRHYVGYQNLTQAERATMRIDDEPTVELDFKALHPTMLYHRLGLTPPKDCYRIFGDDRDFALRDVAKVALLVLINAANESTAAKALASHWSQGRIRKERPTNSLSCFLAGYGTSTSDLFRRLRSFHAPIACFLGSGEGIRLQFEDSELMADILDACVDENLPALPIHDSLVVPAARAVQAERIMQTCYQRRFGLPIRIERKKPKRQDVERVCFQSTSSLKRGEFFPLRFVPYFLEVQMTPVVLKDEFGDRYKIQVDPAWHETTAKDYARRGIHSDAWRKDREWLYTIPCDKGGTGAHIYSNADRDGPRALAFWGTGRRGTIYDRLLEVPGMLVSGDSDLEWILVFPLASFDDVAAIVEPRKKHVLSEENRQVLIDAGQDTRFRARNQVTDSSKTGVSHGVQPVETALESTPAAQARV